jgi:peptidoglycan hydrolase-like protein with peptidoglycan-binding domain
VKGFQEANGLDPTGQLDRETKLALLQGNKPAVIAVRLAAEDVVLVRVLNALRPVRELESVLPCTRECL